MIKTVVREFKWTPEIISELFIDGSDFKGLEFWYNDIFDVHKELKQKK